MDESGETSSWECVEGLEGLIQRLFQLLIQRLSQRLSQHPIQRLIQRLINLIMKAWIILNFVFCIFLNYIIINSILSLII